MKEKTNHEVVVLSTGDYWELMYIDNKLVWEGHSLNIPTFLELIPKGESVDYKCYHVPESENEEEYKTYQTLISGIPLKALEALIEYYCEQIYPPLEDD